MRSSLLLTACAGAALGAVVEEGNSSPRCTKFTDTYDDLTANPVPLLSPVGTYHGLKYGAFVVADVVPGTGGVIPQSKPNVAAATLQTDELQLGSLSLQPFGTIAAASLVKSFDLYSFFFGCVIDDHTATVVVSEGCTIAVTGYYPNGQQAPEVTFAFAPTSPTQAPLNLATLPSTYTGLKNVTFGVANGAVLTADTVLDIDNLVHCNYS